MSAARKNARRFNHKLMRLSLETVLTVSEFMLRRSSATRQDAKAGKYSYKIHVHTSQGVVKYSLNFFICLTSLFTNVHGTFSSSLSQALMCIQF